MDPHQALHECLTSHGINPAAVAAVVASAQPALSFSLTRADDENDIPTGATKFGGSPDLVRGTEWPRAQGVNFRFLAQINLADAAPLLPHPLPESGLLSFFWCQDDDLRTTQTGAAVVYTHPGATLSRVTDPWIAVPDRVGFLGRVFGRKPSPRGQGAWPCSVASSFRMTLPDPFGPRAISRDLLNEREFDRVYGGGLEKPLAAAGVMVLGHRLLGEAAPVQGAVEYEAETESLPPRTHDSAAAERAAARWRLLLQVDSDDAPGYCFGDWGSVYFMMRDTDLASRRWDRARVVVQCH